MDRREFQDKVHEIAGMDLAVSTGPVSKRARVDRQYLEAEWVTGGRSGGNCWGDTADWPITADPEPELEDLENILIEVCPDLSFIHYRDLKQEIEYSERTQSEYYGNYVVYTVKRISVDTVYDMLKDGGYL
jgi:hypothetical protein